MDRKEYHIGFITRTVGEHDDAPMVGKRMRAIGDSECDYYRKGDTGEIVLRDATGDYWLLMDEPREDYQMVCIGSEDDPEDDHQNWLNFEVIE